LSVSNGVSFDTAATLAVQKEKLARYDAFEPKRQLVQSFESIGFLPAFDQCNYRCAVTYYYRVI